MHVDAIPAFRDNYIWALVKHDRVAVVDPGDAEPVLAFLERTRLELASILVTHHHADHVGGLAALTRRFEVPVFGPAEEDIAGVTEPVRDGDRVDVFRCGRGVAEPFEVIAAGGHTRGHVAYYRAPILFCGDTLFGAGCGRLFEGTPAQMLASLDRLAALPDDTRVFCAHEYTQANLAFALAVEPGNAAVRLRGERVAALRADGEPSVPSFLVEERATNPFLRVREPQVRRAASRHAGAPLDDAESVFATLRNWKNNF